MWSYIKLLLRNKQLRNISIRGSKKITQPFFCIDLKVEIQIQINCRCPRYKAAEWQPWSLTPFFLLPFFLCVCVSLYPCLSLSLSLFLHATGKGLKRNVTAHALQSCATGITAYPRSSLTLKVKSSHLAAKYVRQRNRVEINCCPKLEPKGVMHTGKTYC